MKHVGTFIKDALEARHLQKSTVANEVGITPTYLSAIFQKESIDCALFERICKVIGLNPGNAFDCAPAYNYNVSGVQAESMIGAATINISQGEADALKKLLEEKERTIQILMRAKGFSPE